MEKKPAMPIVTFSTELGKHAEYIDVDYYALSAHMTEIGLTDEEIASTEIQFSDRFTLKLEASKSKSKVTMGEYDRSTDTVSLMPYVDLRRAQIYVERHDTTDDSRTNEEYVADINASLSERYSEVLGHELTHKQINLHSDTNTLELERFNVMIKSTINELGKLALLGTAFALARETAFELTDTERTFFTTYGSYMLAGTTLLPALPEAIKRARQAQYDNDPEEIICRKAEESTPENLVTIRVRTAPETVDSHS